MAETDRTVYLEVSLQRLQDLQEAWERGDQHADVVKLLEQLLRAENDVLVKVPVHRFEQCPFDLSWVGRCKKPIVGVDASYCPKHQGQKCVSCGEQAVHDCEMTGQFVCGAMLCADCVHVAPYGHGPRKYTLAEAKKKLGVES